MNYCSIEDAWGKSNMVSNQFKEYMTDLNPSLVNNSEKQIEHFTDIEKPKMKKYINDDCEQFMIHVRNCRKCYNKMKNQFKPQLVEKFQNIIDENRDTIVIILIGISILLFFNLINNITK